MLHSFPRWHKIRKQDQIRNLPQAPSPKYNYVHRTWADNNKGGAIQVSEPQQALSEPSNKTYKAMERWRQESQQDEPWNSISVYQAFEDSETKSGRDTGERLDEISLGYLELEEEVRGEDSSRHNPRAAFNASKPNSVWHHATRCLNTLRQ
jgi:hypothetical protein